jgi:hypothetical protein
MIKKFIDFFKKKEEPKKEIIKEVVKKDFDIDEFNHWFKTEFTGYDGRKGAAGIFLRTDKLSQYWIEEYLELIGQDTDYENITKYYDLVRKDWISRY